MLFAGERTDRLTYIKLIFRDKLSLYRSLVYGEKDEHKLMNTIIAQMKSYNDEQERKRQKKIKKMPIMHWRV
jgi:hypothetical protein